MFCSRRQSSKGVSGKILKEKFDLTISFVLIAVEKEDIGRGLGHVSE